VYSNTRHFLCETCKTDDKQMSNFCRNKYSAYFWSKYGMVNVVASKSLKTCTNKSIGGNAM
jgi:hypothetical protein